jgi:sterol desaturase/sphingolipid hydroxylase (fatty acid hydroxylase superfamily)
MPETIQSLPLSHGKALLGFAAFFVLVEYFFPASKNQKFLRNDSILDLSYSFLLPLLFIPAQTIAIFYLGNYFYGAIGMPANQTVRPVTFTIVQNPTHGKVIVLEDGSTQYQPGQSFAGLDTFSIKKSDGESSIVKTTVVKADLDQKSKEVFFPEIPIEIHGLVTNRVYAGKIVQGFTGWVLNIRNMIQEQSLLAQIFLAILIVDFAGYWRHRFMHNKLFWPFHTIHHSSKEIDWLSTERFHPVNHFITATLNLIILMALFSNPIASATAMSLRRKYGLFIHSNVSFSYGLLDFIIVSPLFHRWHHSDSTMAFNKNYSTFFSFFDLIFGTYYLPENKKNTNSFGFLGGELTEGLIGQTIYPFFKLAEMIKKS